MVDGVTIVVDLPSELVVSVEKVETKVDNEVDGDSAGTEGVKTDEETRVDGVTMVVVLPSELVVSVEKVETKVDNEVDGDSAGTEGEVGEVMTLKELTVVEPVRVVTLP
ncbi:unnamed protein product [Ambrosiozyma monospora]|uniref:Unnamed protein product n=1 Tax=Ambrosiozyma monospora TaxID=43982 RepID=A0A9W6T5G8_AMBMO|nr:unnamed protein product [Ambrosiozyma monospora]